VKQRNNYLDIKEFSNKFIKNYPPIKKHQNKVSQAYSLMQNNIKKFEHKERSFERMPPKRHSSYEDRLKGSSVSKRNDPRLFVTQRN
jgi:predicted patatin/cPLA2 family phospholipase